MNLEYSHVVECILNKLKEGRGGLAAGGGRSTGLRRVMRSAHFKKGGSDATGLAWMERAVRRGGEQTYREEGVG